VTLFTYGSGWQAAALLAVAILTAGLTHLRRRPPRRHAPGWLRLHTWLGGAAATLGLVHGLGSVTRAQLPPGAGVGLWVASAAMYLVVAEAVLGLYLRAPGTPRRPGCAGGTWPSCWWSWWP
jgi:hypothetical protein